MSLNRCEQTVFDYWSRAPDELRHWQAKVAELTRGGPDMALARRLERDLWTYLLERSPHVPALRVLRIEDGPKVSLLSLAEHLIRLWGPPPKPKRPDAPR
ncbi:MAG: hypothetical protein QG602_207 [Verrucomicrobiota bacterium]|nr:hypothetical protein [Verrucomicrobiota bacterium]